MGCATVPEPEVTSGDLRTLQQRVEDVERTNGRLMVRVEETERQVALMQDRVETNRIALQRQGYLRQRNEEFAHHPPRGNARRPDPAPQSSFSDSDYRADPTMRQRMDQRGVAQISLSQQQSGAVDQVDEYIEFETPSGSQNEGREVVITNETIESYFGSSTSSRASSSTSSSNPSPSPAASAPRQGRSAHPPVTDERLATTAELGAQREQGRSAPVRDSSEPRSHRELLELYQESLTEYRAGNYATALRGFTEFLEAGPRSNWIDNALYWIGECHYGLGEYSSSVRYFQRIIDELPNADKVPDAMLKMSLAFERMGNQERSYNLLKELVEKYPRSNPGRLGLERMEAHPLHRD